MSLAVDLREILGLSDVRYLHNLSREALFHEAVEPPARPGGPALPLRTHGARDERRREEPVSTSAHVLEAGVPSHGLALLQAAAFIPRPDERGCGFQQDVQLQRIQPSRLDESLRARHGDSGASKPPRCSRRAPAVGRSVPEAALPEVLGRCVGIQMVRILGLIILGKHVVWPARAPEDGNRADVDKPAHTRRPCGAGQPLRPDHIDRVAPSGIRETHLCGTVDHDIHTTQQ